MFPRPNYLSRPPSEWKYGPTLTGTDNPEKPIVIFVVVGGDFHWGINLGTEDDIMDQGKSESERREALDAEITKRWEKAEEMGIEFPDEYIFIVEA
ncbi:hypothetical protein M422DRAFT_246260 [Sphaerobolus stellatus SS14]|nr:hypothetical protein M422DRAFT_246260 [Sphaerobolus stellatus SS14]